MSHTSNEPSYLSRHRRLASFSDFLNEFWKSWVVRVYGWTSSFLSLTTMLLPWLTPYLKLELALGIFSSGLIVSLIAFFYLPKKYTIGLEIYSEDLCELHLVHDGEILAKKANKCARAHFGKTMGFPYELYRKWRAKNKLIFTGFLTRQGDLVGFVDAFPLKREPALQVLCGDISEDDLTINNILSEAYAQNSDHIYIASVVCCVRSSLAQAVILAAAIQHIWNLYPQRPGRVYIAVGATKDGRRTLSRLGFKQVMSEAFVRRKRPIYLLRSEDISARDRLSLDPHSVVQVRLTGLQKRRARRSSQR